MFTVTMSVPHARLARMKAALTDPRGPLERIGRYVAFTHMPAYFKSSGEGSWPAVGRGGQPLLDTGLLVRSWSYSLGIDRKTVRISTPLPYARAHHEGMTITAKNAYKGVEGGPYLAIPLPSLTVSQRRLGPRAFTGKKTFIAKSRNGNQIVFEKVLVKTGERAGKVRRGKSKFASRISGPSREDVIRPLFVLKKSVTLKRRPIAVVTDGLRTWVVTATLEWGRRSFA